MTLPPTGKGHRPSGRRSFRWRAHAQRRATVRRRADRRTGAGAELSTLSTETSTETDLKPVPSWIPDGGTPRRFVRRPTRRLLQSRHGPPHLHRTAAGRDLRRPPPGRPRGRRPRIRCVLPVGSLPPDERRRPPRAHRRLGHPRRAGPRDVDHPPGDAGHLGDLPLPGPPRGVRRAGRRDERWPRRTRARRRVVRRGARGGRDSVPAGRRAVRSLRGHPGHRDRHVGHARGRDLRPPGTPLLGHRVARSAEASAGLCADRHRRRRQEADAGVGRALRQRVQPALRRCRDHGHAVRPRPGGLRRGRARPVVDDLLQRPRPVLRVVRGRGGPTGRGDRTRGRRGDPQRCGRIT